MVRSTFYLHGTYKMQVVLLIVHLAIAIALVGVILLQRSEGGGLGMGGGPGGMMSARGAADLLTKTTSILAVGFLITSLTLAILAGQGEDNRSVLDDTPLEQQQPDTPSVPVPE
jgi:preprotein translocase subunit SecG